MDNRLFDVLRLNMLKNLRVMQVFSSFEAMVDWYDTSRDIGYMVASPAQIAKTLKTQAEINTEKSTMFAVNRNDATQEYASSVGLAKIVEFNPETELQKRRFDKNRAIITTMPKLDQFTVIANANTVQKFEDVPVVDMQPRNNVLRLSDYAGKTYKVAG